MYNLQDLSTILIEIYMSHCVKPRHLTPSNLGNIFGNATCTVQPRIDEVLFPDNMNMQHLRTLNVGI